MKAGADTKRLKELKRGGTVMVVLVLSLDPSGEVQRL